MDQIIIEGVRCFHNRQSVPLRPVTLLVGENSSGKTTFLAVTRIAWSLRRGDPLIDFNEEPFLLGAYDQIASYRGGPAGRAKSFTIGAEISIASRLPFRSASKDHPQIPQVDAITLIGHFTRKEAQPRLEEWMLEAGPFKIENKYQENEKSSQTIITTPSGSLIFGRDAYPLSSLSSLRFGLRFMSDLSRAKQTESGPIKETGKVTQGELGYLSQLIDHLAAPAEQPPQAFAPVRTHPKRTYDPIKDVPSPEGAHVPMILAKMFTSDKQRWEQLRESLDSFGKASGLFNDLEVRRIGREESDPFQIKIKVSGPAFNLVDVGYGISQVLPIVVEAVRGRKGGTFLLQQPEVHLHPKAQAELGSFLATLAKHDNKRFVIETHSDYLVDRIRMDVRDGKHLSPDDVALLYFERKNGNVEIKRLELDRFGNITNAPAGYRQFFLEEEMRLLGA
jgi:hypothetical protein